MSAKATTPRPDEIPGLTGLRFFAAFAIVLNHAGPVIFKFANGTPLSPTFETLGRLGMTVFFILSGFIIHYNYSRSVSGFSFKGIYNFFVARFSRLYPLFILLLLVDFTCASFFVYSSPHEKIAYLSLLPFFLTMTQSWFFFFVNHHFVSYPYWYTNVSWSVSTEVFFYLCYPLIAFLFTRIKSRFSSLALLVATIAGATILFAELQWNTIFINHIAATWGLISDPAAVTGATFQGWLSYTSPYSRIFEFLVGCAVAVVFANFSVREVSRKELTLAVRAIPACLFVLFVSLVPFDPITAPKQAAFVSGVETFGTIPALGILIFCIARYRTWLSALLSSAAILALGEASYSIYMIHFIVVDKFSLTTPVMASGANLAMLTLRFLILCVTIVALSMMSFRFVEAPARRWLRNRLAIRSTVRVSSALQGAQ